MSGQVEHAGYAVRMKTRQWLVVDATMDNEISVEAVDGDPRGVVELGSSIRQAGWDQIPDWPHELAGFAQWPAPGQTSTMVLTGSQWELVASALERWAGVSEGVGDPGSAESVKQSRAIAALVRGQLAEQGWEPH
jgi:hypothetical protein